MGILRIGNISLHLGKECDIKMALDYNIIGERLKKARQSKNLTQEMLSEKLDMSIAYLSRLECGSSQISLKRLDEMCEILDVSKGYILEGTSVNSKNYLNKEFSELLANCPQDKYKLIYNIAKVIVGE